MDECAGLTCDKQPPGCTCCPKLIFSNTCVAARIPPGDICDL